ncbi:MULTISPECIES: hypothetical protein [Reichenbachiella]|uniref:hypothetical protein n=1 Tax=Reichenbachiella TaxID=156993 RepID=UPI000EBD521E|nr:MULTISPECIES: hypothetical protein [Reichenbachiella]MBU2912508.1 hypothetical protein [Reichenbachiella agariperforans]RJE72631.1 hypothetical protein BGP76_01285 [Reichenbachiella sp. MSK19-1]
MKILLVIFATSMLISTPVRIDSKIVYKALSGDSMELVTTALAKLEKESESAEVRAYTGALLTKKASFVKGVADKVKAFKEGATMLEEEIEADGANIEFRFLRLAVQEKSPGILGYKDNMDEDKKMILENYSDLSASLRKQIANYAQSSEFMPSSELPK